MKIDWSKHAMAEERATAQTEQDSLRESGGSFVLSRKGAQKWLKEAKATRVILYLGYDDREFLSALMSTAMNYAVSIANGSTVPDLGWL